MSVHQNSIDAYYDEKKCGREGSVRRKIFNYMREFRCPVTRQDISERLDIKINVVCGRVKELLESEAIEVSGNIEATETSGPRELLMVKAPQLDLFVIPENQQIKRCATQ